MGRAMHILRLTIGNAKYILSPRKEGKRSMACELMAFKIL